MKSNIKTLIGCFVAMAICSGAIILMDKDINNHWYMLAAGFALPCIVGIVGLIYIGIKKLKEKNKCMK